MDGSLYIATPPGPFLHAYYPLSNISEGPAHYLEGHLPSTRILRLATDA